MEILGSFNLGDNKNYTFYEKIEIASSRSIPEIDVGMLFSFVGTISLKKFGFSCSNLFQILSLGGFLLLYFLILHSYLILLYLQLFI